MQQSQNYYIEIVASFPRVGNAEGLVLDRLAYACVKEGPGREWVRASLSEILHAIGIAVEFKRA